MLRVYLNRSVMMSPLHYLRLPSLLNYGHLYLILGWLVYSLSFVPSFFHFTKIPYVTKNMLTRTRDFSVNFVKLSSTASVICSPFKSEVDSSSPLLNFFMASAASHDIISTFSSSTPPTGKFLGSVFHTFFILTFPLLI